MGATFKENVEDIRNSKVADVVKELSSYGVTVEVTDPKADSEELKQEYGFELVSKPGKDYDAVIIAVNHNEYKDLTESWFQNILSKDGLVVDIKGVYKGKIKETKKKIKKINQRYRTRTYNFQNPSLAHYQLC